MKKTTLQDMRKILVDSPEGSDRHFWGQVTKLNKNAKGKVTSYEVALGGGEGTMTCRKLAGADVGDTVMVTLTKTGMAVVTGTVDGDKDAENALETAQGVQANVDALSETVEDIEDLVGDGDESGITVTTQYYLSTSNTTQTGGTWSDTLPAYVEGRYYWTKTITTYADGSTVESTPILDVAAQTTAEVNAVATATDQHFWSDSSGAYVTKTNKSLTSGYAMKITTNGLLQTYNGNNLMALTGSGLSLYQSDGRTLLASYSSGGCYLYGGGTLGTSVTSSGVTIYGGSTTNRAEMTSDGLGVYKGNKKVASFGNGAVLGDTDDYYVTVDGTYGVSLRTPTNTNYGYMGYSGFKFTDQHGYYGFQCYRYGFSVYVNNYDLFSIDSSTVTINSRPLVIGSTFTAVSSDDDLVVDSGAIRNKWAVSNADSYTANVHIGSAGRLFAISGSSKRWKNSIEDIHDEALDPHRLYDIEVKQFKFNTDYIKNPKDQRYDTLVPGFIAEQIQEHYPIAVDVDEDSGEVRDWNMKFIIPPMLALIQEQKKELDEIEAELAEIRKKLFAA